jgi:opacity protein-like surface antigen
MKRLICATLALTLLGATAASAQSHYRGGYGHYNGYRHGGGWHGRGDNGALIGLGVGLFALGAIAAASQRDRYYDRYDYGPPPPPPPPAYGRYGYDYGY